MQRKLVITILLILLSACGGAPVVPTPMTNHSMPLSSDSDTLAALPQPYTGVLELVPAEESSEFCDVESPFSLPSEGVSQLGLIPNRRCTEVSSDLDLFEVSDRLYVAQRNGRGLRIVDVTNPTRPAEIGSWLIEPRASRGHIEAFRQFDRWYLALPLESPSPYAEYPCGILIIDVTNPESPALRGRYDGNTIHSDVPWCNVHSVEVDTDAEGNATHFFAATPNTADLRVLDIRNLDDIHDINAFHLHDHPHGGSGSWAHRAVILGDRIYISYWGGGVVIVDKNSLKTGVDSDTALLAPPDSIDPEGYTAHDSQPTADGNFLFVNDMDRAVDGIRLYDIRELAHPREIWVSDFSDTETGNHTLQLQDDLLFVPWFREGLRVFRFDLSDPDHPVIDQVAFQSVRRPPYLSSDGGISSLRVNPCRIEGVYKRCIYASDEEMGLIILAMSND